MSQIIAELEAVFRADTTKFVAGVGAAAAALYEVGKAVEEQIKENLRYAESVEDVTRITGNSAEASSRLIQVADDLKISEQELGAALQGAVRKGVDVSIEGIAKLSDEYLQLAPGLERSKFLMDNFGRSGMSMAAMMEKGSRALKEMYGGVEDGFVITKEAIRQAKEYELALDGLEDAWASLKMNVFQPVIPMLTKLIDGITSETEVTNELVQAKMDEGYSAERALELVKEEIVFRKQLARVISGMSDDYNDVGANVRELTGDTEDLAEATKDVAKTTQVSTKEISEAWDNVAEIMSGGITDKMDAFGAQQSDLYKEQQNITNEIAELEKRSWLTKDQKEQLETLKQKWYDITNAISASQQQQEKEEKRYALRLLEQTGIFEDLGEAGPQAYMDIAREMGVVDDKTYNLVTATLGIKDAWERARLEGLERYQGELNNIPRQIVIEILQMVRTQYSGGNVGMSLPGGVEAYNYAAAQENEETMRRGYASGADFVVPPGYPNDSYIMGVQSGEHVSVTPTDTGMGGNRAITLLEKIASKPQLDERRLAVLIRDAVLQVAR